MTPRQKRMALVAGIIVGVGIAAGLTLKALRSNVMFFFDPSQIAAGEAPQGERFRLGGMVEKGSVVKSEGSLDIRFLVTDFKHQWLVARLGEIQNRSLIERQNPGDGLSRSCKSDSNRHAYLE